MSISLSPRALMACLAILLSVVPAGAAAISSAAVENAPGQYDYCWILAVPADGGEAALAAWSLPLVLGGPEDVDALSIATPYDYWTVEFTPASGSSWGYQAVGDPHAGGYADPAGQFVDPAWVLEFTFDAAKRDLRASALPGLVQTMTQRVQTDVMELQVRMNKYNQAMELLNNLIRMQANELLIQMQRKEVAQCQSQLDAMRASMQGHQAELGRLEDELDYATTGVDGISPGMTGEFSLSSVLAPAAGPACLDDAAFVPAQVPFAPIPEPTTLGLLAIGATALIRRRR